MVRTPVGRHARSGRSSTPRRWLPVLVLLAVVVGSVFIVRDDSADDQVRTAVAAPQSMMPTAAVPDAVSSTWFCSAGTAVAPGAGADLSFVVSNADDQGTQATVTVFGPGSTRKAETVDVPAAGRVRVNAREVLPGDWAAATVEVFGGRATVERRVEGPRGFEVSPCSSAASTRWYVPSGSTVRGAIERLVLFNPFPDPTAVDVHFDTDDGSLSPRALQGVSVPGRSLRVLTIENPSRRPQVAATVTTRSGRVVVDRLQSYDGTGDPVPGAGPSPVSTDAPVGLASTPAIPARASRWFFPEARLVPGGRTQVAVHNPGSTTAEVDVVIGYEHPDRFDEVEPVQLTLEPGQESVVDLTDDPSMSAGAPFTVDVRSLDKRPVVAELLWFTGSRESQGTGEAPPSQGEADEGAAAGEAGSPEPGLGADGFPIFAPGFSVTAGSPTAARSWFLAGRGGDEGIESQVVVANTGAEPVKVSVAELTGGRRRPMTGATVTIPGNDRRVLDLDGAQPWSGLVISGDGPLVVGRIVWSAEASGTSTSIATPFPDQVVPLPAIR